MVMRRDDAGQSAAHASADDPAGSKDGHGVPDAARIPFFIDVSDGDGKHSGGKDALQKSPGDDLAESRSRSGENGREREQEGRPDHGSLAPPAIGKPAKNRRGQRDGDRRSGDREADGKLAGMKQVRQHGEQRLRGKQIHVCAGTGEHTAESCCARGRRLPPIPRQEIPQLLHAMIVHNSAKHTKCHEESLPPACRQPAKLTVPKACA